jgi:hypothetical protein
MKHQSANPEPAVPPKAPKKPAQYVMLYGSGVAILLPSQR